MAKTTNKVHIDHIKPISWTLDSANATFPADIRMWSHCPDMEGAVMNIDPFIILTKSGWFLSTISGICPKSPKSPGVVGWVHKFGSIDPN